MRIDNPKKFCVFIVILLLFAVNINPVFGAVTTKCLGSENVGSYTNCQSLPLPICSGYNCCLGRGIRALNYVCCGDGDAIDIVSGSQEVCDKNPISGIYNLKGESCASIIASGWTGTLRCNMANCKTFDISGCVPLESCGSSGAPDPDYYSAPCRGAMGLTSGDATGGCWSGMCCGDDTGGIYKEIYKTRNCGPAAWSTCGDVPSDKACCKKNECVWGGRCYDPDPNNARGGWQAKNYAVSGKFLTCSEGGYVAQWGDPDYARGWCKTSIGGDPEGDWMGTYCCGDDSNENYVTNYCTGSGPAKCCPDGKPYIKNGNCVASCCDCSGTACHPNNNGKVCDGCYYVNAPAEACDGKDTDCDGTTDEGFNADNCERYCSYNYGSGLFSGAGTANKKNCCGDDSNENYNTENTQPGASIAFDNNQAACCSSSSACVAGGNCYRSYNTHTSLGQYSGLNTGNDKKAFCFKQGGVGNWLDCDYAGWMNTWCANSGGAVCGKPYGGGGDNTRCRTNQGGTASGETTAFGEYTSKGQCGCCGDDANENYITSVCSGSSTNTALCCNSASDMINDGACVSVCPVVCSSSNCWLCSQSQCTASINCKWTGGSCVSCKKSGDCSGTICNGYWCSSNNVCPNKAYWKTGEGCTGSADCYDPSISSKCNYVPSDLEYWTDPQCFFPYLPSTPSQTCCSVVYGEPTTDYVGIDIY